KDAVQEAFMRLWRSPAGYHAAESKLGWLYRVAERCCFDQRSRRATRSTAARYATAAAEPNTHGDEEAIEDRDPSFKFLGQLDQRLRQVAIFHYLDQMGQEEIAVAIGCSRQTVVKRLGTLRHLAELFRVDCLDEGEAP